MTGSCDASGPGRISSRVVSESPAAAGVWLKETYWLSGRVLVAGRGLHRGDDLAGDAELGEVAEARLAVGAVVADRLVEAEQAFLDQVVGLAAEQEVGRGLEADEAAVAADDRVVGVGAAVLGESDQIVIIKLRLRVSLGWSSGAVETARRESHFLRRRR